MEIQITDMNEITGATGASKYELILDGKGKGRGHHAVFDGTEDIVWKVKSGSLVEKILAITWKPTSGSTDIFGTMQPYLVNDKMWKAKVNSITDDVVYVYSINFKKEKDPQVYVFDPIISIRPSTNISPVFTFLVRSWSMATISSLSNLSSVSECLQRIILSSLPFIP